MKERLERLIDIPAQVPFLPRTQYGTRGMVATSHPLAAQAGLQMLKRGGNAVDAAIAAAITLTVVEPTSNGIGGDAFAIVWDGNKLYGLNGSGRSISNLEAQKLQLAESAPFSAIPQYGWLPVTVPGAPRVWRDLHSRFGQLPLCDLFQPAIDYAKNGFVVTPVVASCWAIAAREYGALQGSLYEPWRQTFLLGGRAPRVGELFRNPDQAATLATLADTQTEAFYTGELAERIVTFAANTGGMISYEDLASHASEWVEPLSIKYRDAAIYELPPNTQGIVALMALGILNQDEPSIDPLCPTFLHRQVEAIKLAFADGLEHIADPRTMVVNPAWMLDAERLKRRWSSIHDEAQVFEPDIPNLGGTVYLATADAEGRMVSMIQSNYLGFGSGIVIPRSGIALHNRGANFSLRRGHPNALAPEKRPYHTIIPGFLITDRMMGPFGIMGGFMQPQGHVQLISRLVDYEMDPQTALNYPRFQWMRGLDVKLEHHMPKSVAINLSHRRHQVFYAVDVGGYDFGRGQIIMRRKDGVLLGASDQRADGIVAAF